MHSSLESAICFLIVFELILYLCSQWLHIESLSSCSLSFNQHHSLSRSSSSIHWSVAEPLQSHYFVFLTALLIWEKKFSTFDKKKSCGKQVSSIQVLIFFQFIHARSEFWLKNIKCRSFHVLTRWWVASYIAVEWVYKLVCTGVCCWKLWKLSLKWVKTLWLKNLFLLLLKFYKKKSIFTCSLKK